MPPIRVDIVSHTHWDREWHVPFEVARLRLEAVVEQIVSVLENDPAFRHYLLDGQTAPVDDVYELNPVLGARVADLVRAGRIDVGPWTVLPDEFLVSGETLVRNLQVGLRRAVELGATDPVGYLPDSFGHAAQMPQLLRQAGITHAVVWRGVPAAVRRDRFRWRGLDGSEVLTEHLYGSYANGRDLPHDGRELVARAHAYRTELGRRRGDVLLLMNGGDQRTIEPWVPAAVEAANRAQHHFRFEITSLAEHLRRRDDEAADTWQGELRSAAFANLLPGVVSNRVDLRRTVAEAERAVAARAEPLAALFTPYAYPYRELQRAWHLLILNSAHDSVCGCTADDVSDEVLVRYLRARQIGDALADRALEDFAARMATDQGDVVVANLTPRARSGLVEVACESKSPRFRRPDASLAATQLLGADTATPFQTIVRGAKVGWVLDLIDERGFQGRPLAEARIERLDDNMWSAVIRESSAGEEPIDVSKVRRKLSRLGDDDQVIRVRVDRAPRFRVLVDCGSVPAFGWTTLSQRQGNSAAELSPASNGPVTATSTELSNGVITVRVDSAGTWSIESADGLRAHGLGRLVDGGDAGDTYNWSPPDRDQIVDGSVLIERRVTEHGPLRGRIELRARLVLPVGVLGDHIGGAARHEESRDVEVVTRLELRAGEEMVRVSVELDNVVRDHRLRAHFPLPSAVEISSTGCAFGVVERPLGSEGGPHETGVATHPARGFVDASDGRIGLAALTDSATEYELIDGKELAITLLRATGYLSRVAPSTRPNPAGPAVPLSRPQLQRRIRREYALLLHRGDWQEARLVERATEYERPLESFTVGGAKKPTPSAAPGIGSALRVDGAEVCSASRERDALVVRVVRVSHRPGAVAVERHGVPARGERIDLVGTRMGSFTGEIELGAFEIATLRILEPPS